MLPTTGDLKQLLESEGGFTIADPDRLEFLIADAYAALMDESGVRPFLSTVQTRKYEMARAGAIGTYRGPKADRILALDTPIAGNHATATVAVLRGTSALMRGSDYWLKPDNNDMKGRPFTWIEFASPIATNPQTMSVTAPFGWSQTLPPRACRAVLEWAGYKFALDFRKKAVKGIKSWQDGDSAASYDIAQIATLGDDWLKTALDAFQKFRLTEMVLMH